MKKIVLLYLACIIYGSLSAQFYSLATGINNGNNTFIDYRDPDDTWVVEKPNGNTINAKVCEPYPGWATNSGCSRWITVDIATFNNGPSNCQSGIYKYKTTINLPTINPCIPITSALLNLNTIAGDNDIQWFKINGYSYAIIPGVNNFGSFLSQQVSINPAHLVSGNNTLEIHVNNTTLVSGLNICGNLNITRTAALPLQPSITGNSTYCQGGNLSFMGSDGQGTATSHFWEILEWNTSNNSPVPGGYVWSSWYTGAPGNYTFPIASLLPCNKTYKVKLAVSNACQSWVETNKFIYFACNPVNAGSNQVVPCAGSCTQIGTPGQTGFSYQWTNSSGAVIGNTAQITVCPTATSTYTLTVTNIAQNCTGTDNVTVFIGSNNNPAFDTTIAWGPNNAYVTCTVTPIVTNANTQPDFGEMYIVEEINGFTGATIPDTRSADGNNPNPHCWWVYPNALSFKGYDATKTPVPGDLIEDVNNNSNCHLVTPVPGKFKPCRYYRITRGTWNANCPWAQSSIIFYKCNAMPRQGGEPVVVKDWPAPDYSYLRYQKAPTVEGNPLNSGALVYPNPGRDVFTVATAKYSGATLIVYDPVGKEIKRIMVGKQATISLNLSGYQPGTYTLKIMTKTKADTEKLVLLQ